MAKLATYLILFVLPLLPFIPARSSSFTIIETQSKIDILSAQLSDYELSKDEAYSQIEFGSFPPTIEAVFESGVDIASERKQVARNTVESFRHRLASFEIDTQSPSKACKSFESTVQSIAAGFLTAASQNSNADLNESSLLRKGTCFLFKDLGTRPASTCDPIKSTRYSKHLISKIRMQLLIRQLDIARSYFLLGLNSSAGEKWSTNGKTLQYTYEACHPNNPKLTLVKLDELRLDLSETAKTLVGSRGLVNLKNDRQMLGQVKDSYNFRKGYRKVVGFAATLATLEIAAIAAASKINGALQNLSFMKSIWVSAPIGFGIENATSIAAFAAADAVANGSDILNSILNDKEEFEEEVRYFAEDDNLYQQNLDYLNILLQSENEYETKILQQRKEFLASRPENICELVYEVQTQMASVSRVCTICNLNLERIASCPQSYNLE